MVWVWSFWWFAIFMGIFALSILGYFWGYHGWRFTLRQPIRAEGEGPWDEPDEAKKRGWLAVLSLTGIMIAVLLWFVIASYSSMWGPYTFPKTNAEWGPGGQNAPGAAVPAEPLRIPQPGSTYRA